MARIPTKKHYMLLHYTNIITYQLCWYIISIRFSEVISDKALGMWYSPRADADGHWIRPSRDTSTDRRVIQPSEDASTYRHGDVGYGHSSQRFITPGNVDT